MNLREQVALEVMLKLLQLETHLTPAELARKSFDYAQRFVDESALRQPSSKPKPLPPTPPRGFAK